MRLKPRRLGAFIFMLIGAGVALAAAPASAHEITIVNGTRWAIHRIFLSPCDSRYWGPNRFGETSPLARGATTTVAGVAAGCYAVKTVDQDGDTCVFRNVSVQGNLTWTFTDKTLADCAL